MQAFYTHRDTLPGAASQPVVLADYERFDVPGVRSRYVVDRDEFSEASIDIGGMYCGACGWLLDRALRRHAAVLSVDVNPVTKRSIVQWRGAGLSFSEVLASIAAVGFQPRPVGTSAVPGNSGQEYRSALKRLIVAAAAGMQVMMFAFALYAGERFGIAGNIETFLRAISMLVCLPIVFYSARPFFAGAWRGLRARSPGMDLPVAVAIGIAFIASVAAVWRGQGAVYFDSVAMFVLFLSGTRFLEMRARHTSGDLAQALAQLLPETVRRFTNNADTETVAVSELTAGDRLRVLPGDVVPADARIEDGGLSLDESILTGESAPVHRDTGSEVFAGATVRAGSATVEVIRTGAASSVAEIARLLDRAAAGRPRIVQLADRIASYFVVAVLLLAAVTGAIWLAVDAPRAFEVMLATLVVTCPCALALATPAVLAAATARLARDGCFLVNSRLLDVLRPGTTVVMDKTGTLTRGKPTVTRTRVFENADGLDEAACLAIASAMEAVSEHVLARAFSAPLSDQFKPENAVPVTGMGVEAEVNGRRYRLGSAQFVAGLSGVVDQATCGAASSDGTLVYLANENGLLAVFTVEDELRTDVGATVDALRAAGYRVVIASGDRAVTVAALAATLSIVDWRAEMSPQCKLQFVHDLQRRGEKVIMIGDGINDAPVMAAADASIAVDAGTALARASADAIVVSSRLAALVSAAEIAALTRRTIRQNLVWAVTYNMAAVPLAATGMLAPWMAALGMSLSSLLVISNALRVQRHRVPRSEASVVEPRTVRAGVCT